MDTSEGTLCWIEIPAKDMEKVYGFYSKAFPKWQFTDVLAKNEEGKYKPILIQFASQSRMGGGIVPMPAECKVDRQPMGTGLLPYFFVDSINESIPRIEKLGGKLTLPKMDESDNGWFCNFDDVEGNRFGLYQLNPNRPQGSGN